jgi:hypothetical protein
MFRLRFLLSHCLLRFAKHPLTGAGRGKQIAKGGIQAEGGIETFTPIPPLVSLRFLTTAAVVGSESSPCGRLEMAEFAIDRRVL